MGIPQHFRQKGIGIGYFPSSGIKEQYPLSGFFKETAVTGFRDLQPFLQFLALVDVGNCGLAERIIARAGRRWDGIKLGVEGFAVFLKKIEGAGLFAFCGKYFF